MDHPVSQKMFLSAKKLAFFIIWDFPTHFAISCLYYFALSSIKNEPLGVRTSLSPFWKLEIYLYNIEIEIERKKEK